MNRSKKIEKRILGLMLFFLTLFSLLVGRNGIQAEAKDGQKEKNNIMHIDAVDTMKENTEGSGEKIEQDVREYKDHLMSLDGNSFTIESHRYGIPYQINGGIGYRTNDGAIAYCHTFGVHEAPQDFVYDRSDSEVASNRLSYILVKGFPNTNTIAGENWSDDDAEQLTQIASWLDQTDGSLTVEEINAFFAEYRYHLSQEFFDYAYAFFQEADAYEGGDGSIDGYAMICKRPHADTQDMLLVNTLPGTLSLTKKSSNPAVTDGNGCYTLEGAVYGLYTDQACENQLAIFTTDENGASTDTDNSLAFHTLQPGTYYVKELVPSRGYALDETVYDAVVSAGKRTTLAVQEVPLKDAGNLTITKVDQDSGKASPQGNGSLANAEFTIRYYDGYYERENLPAEPTAWWVMKTNELGVTALSFGADYQVDGSEFYRFGEEGAIGALPLGTVTIQETKAPAGYTVPEDGAFTLQKITENEKTQEVSGFTDLGVVVHETPIRGGVLIEKWDQELNRKQPQGSASLEGAEFTITSLNEKPVTVAGKTYQKGEVVVILSTNKEGVAQSDAGLLPYGDYQLTETKAPKQYTQQGAMLSQKIEIRESGVLVTYNTEERAVRNVVQRGGVLIEKQDSELKVSGVAQGEATLQNTEFAILTNNENPVVVEGVEYHKGDIVKTISTGNQSVATSGEKVLPVGSYTIKEVKTPEGYQSTGSKISREFTITKEGEMIELKEEKSTRNDVVRGGVQVQKWDAQLGASEAVGGANHGENTTGTRLSDIVFTITNACKSPVVVDGVKYGANEVVCTIKTHWNAEVHAYTAETQKDALPFGTYTIKETKTNEGYLLSDGKARTFVIRNQGVLVTKDTTGNPLVFKNQVLRGDFSMVKIADSTSKRLAVPFILENVTSGEKHVVVTDKNGEFSSETSWNAHSCSTNGNDGLMEAKNIKESDMDTAAGIFFGLGEDGHMADVKDELGALPYGEYVLTELRCENNEGDQLQNFTFYIYKNNKVVNLGTITDDKVETEELIPSIKTTAVDQNTEDHLVAAGEEVTVIDTVHCEGLTPGKEYTIKGVLTDAEDEGTALKADGKKIKAEVTFTAERVVQDVEVPFVFDSTLLSGKTGVVFEKLYEGRKEVAAHEDWGDTDQTVYFPEVKTSAKDAQSNSQDAVAEGEITIVDTVEYANLIAGKEYTIQGTLYVKDTEEALLVNEKKVQAETTFIPEETSGSVEVVFTFDGTGLGDQTVVVFENLIYRGILVASHADIEDEAQSVNLIKPKTPETPNEDTKKEETPKNPVKKVVSAVKTGDTNSLFLFLFGLMVFSAATIAIVISRKERR